jgi:hypothetical protein
VPDVDAITPDDIARILLAGGMSSVSTATGLRSSAATSQSARAFTRA